jgi:catechol 2,3-dioxygenase-like lactoylglutathione lyase family enzyme
MTDAPIIDHIGWQVDDYDRAIKFYTAALKPLGWTKMREFNYPGGKTAGYGTKGKPYLWLSSGAKTAPRIHVALGAESRAAVDAFYKAAMKAGGTDNGPPGTRAEYHPTYYAAFVLDADGHNIEAVSHAPAKSAATKASVKKAAKKPAAKRKPAKRKKK